MPNTSPKRYNTAQPYGHNERPRRTQPKVNDMVQTILRIIIAAAFFMTAAACAGSGEPTGSQIPSAPPTQPSSQPPDPSPAPAAVQVEQARAGPQPPPKDELVKFANWDDNPVKLLNWIAAYIVAHGLDRPIRIIDAEDAQYQDRLLQNDVDIVLAADPAWAKDQSESGALLLLDNPSPVDPNLVVAVHPSMTQRAADVIELLENLRIESGFLAAQSAMIRGGRIGLKENVIGLNILKKNPEVWTPWVSKETSAVVAQAVEDGKIGHCREFVNYAPDQVGNEGSRYCKDDPTKASGNR